MENLMMDFLDHPDFVRELLRAIADYNITQVKKAVEYDIDAVVKKVRKTPELHDFLGLRLLEGR